MYQAADISKIKNLINISLLTFMRTKDPRYVNEFITHAELSQKIKVTF